MGHRESVGRYRYARSETSEGTMPVQVLVAGEKYRYPISAAVNLYGRLDSRVTHPFFATHTPTLRVPAIGQ